MRTVTRPGMTSRPIALAILLMLGDGATTAATGGGEGIKHIVFCWLQQPSRENRARVIETSKELAVLPGIEDIAVGEALPGNRDIVDDSFDVGVSMTFRNRRAMENYLSHPGHVRRVREVLQPMCGKILVYDIAY